MKILLLGLGRANLAVAEFLVNQGCDLYLYEENINMISDTARELIEKGNIKNYRRNNYDLAVTSPGFPEQNEIIKKLRTKGIPIIDEIEFTYQQLNEPKIIAVTGTNGKSTTASIISNILSSANVRNFLGGNISPGRPFSRSLSAETFDYYVLEISSFQLTRIEKFHPYIAVLTNISKDHLNWHRNFEEYRTAKLRIFLNQEKSDYAVLNKDDSNIKRSLNDIRSQIVFFGSNAHTGAWFNDMFAYAQEKLFSVEKLRLEGEHNKMNALASIAVAKILGIDNSKIEKGLMTFEPLPHRLEEVGIIQGVRHVNNSMCTNEIAAIASFKAIKGPKIVIVGGKQKGDKAEDYLLVLAKEAKACVILGENAAYIANFFEMKGFAAFTVANSMDDALVKARQFAAGGDTILLNPGFASFDYFTNFADRGEAFKNAVQKD
jgi:UDP-N-acetylmuramoylalanine--D-glutamate ligase